MELMQEEVKGYSDSREEEEEEEITREESSNATTNTESGHNSSTGLGLHQQDAASNFMNNQRKQLDFMDLTLGSNKEEEANLQQGGVLHPHGHGATSSSTSCNEPVVEKEHMFDKVVTPSDVGKLNRLVIPKQHAEKYFPLDSSSNDKGLLLNFEDRNGKMWRFRYSYWNSSQSYVMTKGWSRFVKEKKLDAGDVVSFQRGLGELYRHRLYIDWRRRPDHAPDHPSTSLITPLFLPIRWGGRLYSQPSPISPTSAMPPRYHDHFQQQQLNYNNMYTFHHHQQQQPYHHHSGGSGSSHHNNNYNELNSGSGSVYYLRSTPSMPMGEREQQERGNNIVPMIIDSVPVGHHHHHHHHLHGSMSGATTITTSTSTTSGNSTSTTTTTGKRLRLFGVNMECASSNSSVEESKCLSSASAPHGTTMVNSLPSSSSSSLPPLQRSRVPHEDLLSSSASRFGDQREGTSLLFDLDPSLQYRQ